MQQAHYQFAYHVHQIAKLLYSGQTAKVNHYTAQLEQDMQNKLSPWLNYALASEFPIGLPELQAPLDNYHACASGWNAYYRHDYLLAHDYFAQAMQADNWQQYALTSALGLAKVYTRSGHWQAARDWCLYYLSLAREQSHHFDVAKGYGALAEIFLRASYANEALACFQTAYHLMPLGQGQQSKQYNYMASALMRNKEALRAEVLLHTSRQISRNVLDIDPDNQDALASLCHSTMRFYYLNLLQFESATPAAVNQDDEKLMLQIAPSHGLAKVPLGLLQMAKGIGCLKNDAAQAQTYFTQAMENFGPKLVMEYQWAARLQASCTGSVVNENMDMLNVLFALQPIAAPTFAVVLDHTWQQVKLNNQGFLPLMEAHTSEQLADLWTLFFI